MPEGRPEGTLELVEESFDKHSVKDEKTVELIEKEKYAGSEICH